MVKSQNKKLGLLLLGHADLNKPFFNHDELVPSKRLQQRHQYLSSTIELMDILYQTFLEIFSKKKSGDDVVVERKSVHHKKHSA